ncbi:MAG: glycoside hydrolase family 99-like domain-containing protein [Ignavibacteria bacterium]|nr:glycoside hydrolase family 99-like domain-containing protein [Ignavibacteria bacterium]
MKEAKTYFEFQVQPKIPLNSNYYDITNGNVIKWQIDLAKQHNVFGFCLYHYWSNGKRILSDGVDSFLRNNDNFPFSFCWANHNWTRQWQGKGNEILFHQEYSKLDIQAQVNWLVTHVFCKTNYIRINGKLLFTIFSIYNLPDAKEYIAQLREEAKKYYEELFIISMLKTNKHSQFSKVLVLIVL